MSENELKIDEIMERFGFCNCGRPAEALRAIRSALRVANEEKSIQPETEAEWLLAYVLTREDYLEHGGSVGYSWLTQRGEALLAELETLEL